MNSSWSQRKKNWQWRIIIWTSLFLIFGKSLGHFIYNSLGIDQAYTATADMAKRAGFSDVFKNDGSVAPPQMIIDVRNDTPNEYTIETKVVNGQADFVGHTLQAGNSKRFTLKPQDMTTKTGMGDIIFLSAPMNGSNNTTCQEIHTLNYDLQYSNQVKQPLTVNLSSIASKMDCKENTSPR